jgi:hypothetical protein
MILPDQPTYVVMTLLIMNVLILPEVVNVVMLSFAVVDAGQRRRARI